MNSEEIEHAPRQRRIGGFAADVFAADELPDNPASTRGQH